MLIAFCYNVYSQSKQEILDYINTELEEELMSVAFSDVIIDALNAFVCEDWDALTATLDNIDQLKNNDRFHAAINLARSDRDARAALKKTAFRALRKKWTSLFK